MAPHFIYLLSVLLFRSLVLAQLVPSSSRRIPRQLIDGLIPQAQYEQLREEYERIQCDAGPVPFKVSFAYLDITGYEKHTWEPEGVTAQQVCAKSIYGGFPTFEEQGILSHVNIAPSADGFCGQRLFQNGETQQQYFGWESSGEAVSPDPTEDNPPAVVFGDESNPGRPRINWNSRLKLYCRNTCFCSRRWDPQQRRLIDVTTRPKGYSKSYNTYRRSAINSAETIELEVKKYQWKLRNNPLPGALATAIYERYYGIHDYMPKWASLAPANKLKCSEGEVPNIFIAEPYTSRDFSKILHLCAVALSGGNPGANAGGYCHNPPNSKTFTGSQPLFAPEVHFSDEMTPRPEWRWVNNFRFSAYIRHFCWQSCWCGDEPIDRPRKMSKFWRILGNLDLVDTRSGALQLRKRTPLGGGTSVLVTPAQWRDAPPSSSNQQSCVVEGVDYCKAEPWPVDILGPPPPANPADPSGLYASNAFLSPATSQDIQALDAATCGQSCDGPASTTCSGGQSPGCRCAWNTGKLAHMLGYDPVAGPLAVCVNVAFVTAKIAADRERYGLFDRLGGRDLGHDLDLEQSFLQDLSCPCNSTYISKACCESDTGLIWEPEHFKLGELGEGRRIEMDGVL